MTDNFSQVYAPQILGGIVGGVAGATVEVASPLIGRSLVDGIRRSFHTGTQVQHGDYFMDQSRILLQRHLRLINLDARQTIRESYQEVLSVREKLNNNRGSRLERLLQARDYRRLSKQTYKVVKSASDRAIDDRLMDQIIAEATRLPGGGPRNSPDTTSVTSTSRNPFTDSHAISTLTDVGVNDLDVVEMSTYQSEDTGGRFIDFFHNINELAQADYGSEGAVVMDIHGRDAPSKHIVATFPTEVFSDDRTEREASQFDAPGAAALSVHQEDGSTPRLVTAPAAPVANTPDQKSDGEAKTRAISSVTPTAKFGTPEDQ
ncbi:hypothetical protein BC826DRAFT_1104619 [Russula brevipes]|nr:hypothetical protein BC826DRAFT_1104619 [Russula brevipes]